MQRELALKSLGTHKGFLRLFALHPACVCEISVVFFVFRYTSGEIINNVFYTIRAPYNTVGKQAAAFFDSASC